MAVLKQATLYTKLFHMVQTSDHYTDLTSVTPTVNLSKAGAAFGAAAGAVSEIANGWYKVVLTGEDTGTNGDLGFRITATGGDALNFVDQVQTNLVSDIEIGAGGTVNVASNVKKNQALNGFTFVMTDSSTHTEKTGLTVTAQRSLGGAGFSLCTNAVVEIANGAYSINLSASDLNANVVLLRFTATGADPLDILLITQP